MHTPPASQKQLVAQEADQRGYQTLSVYSDSKTLQTYTAVRLSVFTYGSVCQPETKTTDSKLTADMQTCGRGQCVKRVCARVSVSVRVCVSVGLVKDPFLTLADSIFIK